MWTEIHKLWIWEKDNPPNVELNLQIVDFDLEVAGLIIEKFGRLLREL